MSTSGEISKMIEQLYDIERILSAIQKKPHQYAGVALHSNEAHTLTIIAFHEGISQVELTERMYRTKGATSVMVDKLVAKGLIRRERMDDDQRRYLLTLTEHGHTVHAAHMAYDEAHVQMAAGKLAYSEEEFVAANRVLASVIAVYADYAKNP